MRPYPFELVRRAAVLAALVIWVVPASARADSLLDLFRPDPLADLGAPEAQARTRKGRVIYPAAGLPSLIRPGEEVVVRVRVRRAMTPPPGVQQRLFLTEWRAWLLGRFPLAAPGTTGQVELPLVVEQIRPEDEGFVYRVRLRSSGFTPEGVYDLVIDGPGLFDVAARSVRVISERPEGIELQVVSSGVDLWREAEALWLLDPAAVLVPGGLTEATFPLSRWPLATFAVPEAREVEAWRCLDLSAEAVSEVSDAAGCGPAEAAPSGCVVGALGGLSAMDPCGDELMGYLRQVGPPNYAVGLGAVTLVGLQTYDVPLARRTGALVRLGQAEESSPPEADPSQTWLSAEQTAWLERQASLSEELLVLGARLGAESIDESARGRARIIEGGRGAMEIELGRRPAPPRWEMARWWGLDAGALHLVEARPRPGLELPGLIGRVSGGEGLAVDIARPPAGRLRLRLLVPAADGGWAMTLGDRVARIVAATPANGDLCAVEQIVLTVEVAPGHSGALHLELQPRPSENPPRIELIGPSRPTVVGQPVELGALVEGFEGGEAAPLISWSLGDGAEARGAQVSHRYIRSGPSQVCLAALDLRGRVASTGARVQIHSRGRTGVTAEEPWIRASGVGLGALALALMLLGWLEGNIFRRRRRWR